MQTLYFRPVVSSFFLLSSFFLAYSQPSHIGCLPCFHTWCGEFRMQVWKVLHAACWKYNTQKVAKSSPSGQNRSTSSAYIFAIKACIDNRKKILNSNISPTRPHNMAYFSPPAAQTGSLVWVTPANFDGFRVLAAFLHGTSSKRQQNFVVLNRGCHLYSAGRPSRWALAHILVSFVSLGLWVLKLHGVSDLEVGVSVHWIF